MTTTLFTRAYELRGRDAAEAFVAELGRAGITTGEPVPIGSLDQRYLVHVSPDVARAIDLALSCREQATAYQRHTAKLRAYEEHRA